MMELRHSLIMVPLVFGGGAGAADKHHKGMASASGNVTPREQKGWCLPASLDILELSIQQSPTKRGAAVGGEWRWKGTSGLNGRTHR